MGTLPSDHGLGSAQDLSRTGNALLGGYSLMMAVITTLANLLLIKVLIKDLSPYSNIFTKLFLALVVADTMELTLVALPFSVNQWQGAHDMLGPLVCSVTGAVHFVCDKGSVLVLLVLGVVRLRSIMKSLPPGQHDGVADILSKVAAGMIICLILLSGVPVVTGEAGYRYSTIYFICEWCGGELEESYSTTSHDVSWIVVSIVPHLLMSAGIAFITWRTIGYVSDPLACKPQVFIQAIKETSRSSDTRVQSPSVSESMLKATRPAIAKSNTPLPLRSALRPNSPTRAPRTPNSARAPRSPKSARSPKSLQSARMPISPLRTVRTPRPTRIPTSPKPVRVVKIPNPTVDTPQFRIRIYDTDSMSHLLDRRAICNEPINGSLKECLQSSIKAKAVKEADSEEPRREREIILGHLPARDSSGDTESLKVTLNVQNREEELEGSKSIAMLLMTYTILNLPRWITLLLEFILRVGFNLYASNLLILMCTSLSTFMRCSLTSAVMWWRIISIRNIMNEE